MERILNLCFTIKLSSRCIAKTSPAVETDLMHTFPSLNGDPAIANLQVAP